MWFHYSYLLTIIHVQLFIRVRVVVTKYNWSEFLTQLTGMLNYFIAYFLFSAGRMAQWVKSLDLTTHTSLSPIWRGFAPGFVNYNKGCTRIAAESDKVYQLLAHGRWFSPASSTTKTGRHDIAEIFLKVALKRQKSNPIFSAHAKLFFKTYLKM